MVHQDSQSSHSPRVSRVTDLVEGSNKVVEPVLFKSYTHVKDIVRRSGTMQLPSTRDLIPSMFHPEVIPPLGLGREGLGGGEMREPEDESLRRPEHGGDGAFGVIQEKRSLDYLYTAHAGH